jgi:hypothetical protein
MQLWDGTRWSLVASPNPPGKLINYLWSVSCSTATSCFAVGSQRPDGVGPGSDGSRFTLIERWNGQTWTIMPSPNRPRTSMAGTDNILFGVSCAQVAHCVAVGFGGSGHSTPLIEMWNGSSWTIENGPQIDGALLRGVACKTASNCIAVGDTGQTSTLIERYS